MQRSFLYYDLELKCANCGYETKMVLGPDVPITGEKIKPLTRDILLYCSKTAELRHVKYRGAGQKFPGENQCTACGELFINHTFFESPLQGIKHCWGDAHLELEYNDIVDSNSKINIPCPKCLSKAWVRKRVDKRLIPTEIEDSSVLNNGDINDYNR